MESDENIVARIVSALEGEYGRPEGRDRDPVDSLVRTILSQNTSGVNTDRAYTELRRRFPSWTDVAAAAPGEIAESIRSAGLYRQKSERISAILREISVDGMPNLDDLRRVPTKEAYRRLRAMNGVGPKTAACVVLFALDGRVFPIDTHIRRILTRVGVMPESMPIETAQKHILDLIPQGAELSLHVNLIAHGRKVCKPRKPKCPECVLLRLCATGKKRADIR